MKVKDILTPVPKKLMQKTGVAQNKESEVDLGVLGIKIGTEKNSGTTSTVKGGKITEALSAKDKKIILADFKEWSGGFDPKECPPGEIKKYIRAALSTEFDAAQALQFLRGLQESIVYDTSAVKIAEEKTGEKLLFTPAPENQSLWRISSDNKDVGKISKTKYGYETRISLKTSTIRTLSDAKKWATAIFTKDKSKLPPGTAWPFDEGSK